MLVYVLTIVLIILFLLFASLRIMMEYERAVVLFLGRFQAVKGPGLIIVIPFLQRMIKVDLRTITMDVPSQDLITRDNVSVNVNAVLYFRVTMVRAIAKQAEAERERRAKVIHADGEFQASSKLVDAAEKLSSQAGSMQLRYLQTLTEIAGEKSSTIVFPLPVNVLDAIQNWTNEPQVKEVSQE